MNARYEMLLAAIDHRTAEALRRAAGDRSEVRQEMLDYLKEVEPQVIAMLDLAAAGDPAATATLRVIEEGAFIRLQRLSESAAAAELASLAAIASAVLNGAVIVLLGAAP